ncbi:uncharacterized protein BBOV_IV006350 [Babesia bovis T2Bo]|uniref:Uncharacterized protein n=1 Tax=Babesia bovis TaxID=5865 RepID=A7AR25_BABBO|nr:uncharacterized protein BBOV_IV006350 [Babesia bovis T2Bo]EDO06994.1 hypothetical protein BBOV_IV006350 [Babesia bovis T2Bo]|eukprot:XP_001610562.1 hypothetical protein [Babesia bovis T2Bo]
MGPSTAQAEVLRRVRFAQNRSAYNTVNCTTASSNKGNVYLVEPYDSIKGTRQLEFIKKAFASRRNSKKGPFQKLFAPHVYSNLFGDPSYYSNNELHNTCIAATEMQLVDRHFWWQIAGKLRKVRDVMEIKALLQCMECLVRVKYYDRDLLRLLSREFTDDMHKLDLMEIAKVLQCYARMNVYSPDLVNAAGYVTTSYLMDCIKRDVPFDQLRSSDNDDNQKLSSSLPTTLGILAKCFRMFRYKNRDLYLSIAYMGVKHWNDQNVDSSCALFAYLDPKDFSLDLAVGVDDAYAKNARDVETNTVLALVKQLEHIPDNFAMRYTNSITDEVDITCILPPNTGPNATGYVKAAYDFCAAVRLLKIMVKALSRLANIVTDGYNLTGVNVNSIFDSMMEKIGTIAKRLMASYETLEVSTKTLYSGFTGSVSGGNEVHNMIRNTTMFCPYITASRHMIIDSMLHAVCAVNSTMRLRILNRTSQAGMDNSTDIFNLIVEDSNVSSRLYAYASGVQLSLDESRILAGFLEAVKLHGCALQSAGLVATAIETLAVVSCMDSQVTNMQLEDIQTVSDQLALEAMKNLVSFSLEDRCRMLSALRNGMLKPNPYLEHGIVKTTKLIRKKRRHEIVAEHPFCNLLKEVAVPEQYAAASQETSAITDVK